MQTHRRPTQFTSIAALFLAMAALAGCGGGSGTTSSLAVTPAASNGNPTPATPTSTPTSSAGSASGTASTPPAVAPQPPTGSARISWQAPSTNTDGTALTNLAGFYIHYGYSSAKLDHMVMIAAVNTFSYVVDKLAAGSTYYFAVSSFTTNGVESDKSKVVSKTI